MADVGANPVLDRINSLTETGITQSQNLLQSNMDLVRRSEQYANEVSNIYEEVAKAQHLVSVTKGVGELRAQQAIQRDAFAAGMDPGSTANDMIDALAKHRTETHKVEDLLNRWDTNQTVKFWEDPGAWVQARFEEGALRSEIERTAAKADFQNKRALNLSATVQAAVVAEKAIATTMSAASVEAAATIASAEASIAAKKAAFEGFAANTKGVQFAMQATNEQLGFLYNQKNAANQERNTAIALEHLDLAKKNYDLAVRREDFNEQLRTDAAEAKKEGKELDQWILDRLNIGRKNFGYTDDLTGIAAKAYIQQYKSGDPEIRKFFKSGDLTLSAGGKNMIASNPADAAHALNSGHNLPPGREGAVSYLTRAVEAATTQQLDYKKDPVKYNQFINKFVADAVARDAENITSSSPRFVGDLKSYLGDPASGIPGISSLVALPITEKVFAPIIKSGAPLSDPTMIRALGTQAVLKGVITSSEYTSGLSAIFARANELHLQAADYVGLGIQIPNAGKNYPVRTGAFSGKPLDHTSATELGAQLAKDLARYVGPEGQGGRRGGSSGEVRRMTTQGQ
jgi:hypothetical protein